MTSEKKVPYHTYLVVCTNLLKHFFCKHFFITRLLQQCDVTFSAFNLLTYMNIKTHLQPFTPTHPAHGDKSCRTTQSAVEHGLFMSNKDHSETLQNEHLMQQTTKYLGVNATKGTKIICGCYVWSKSPR